MGVGGDTTSDYVEITTRPDGDTKESIVNPFDTFRDEEDPDEYLRIYDALKDDIRQIESNSKGIRKLSERYQSSTEKEQNAAIMRELDAIMSANSSITRQIKGKLKEAKAANDKYHANNAGSSVGQWRINQLNSCTRRFKSASLEFSQELNQFNATLRDKQKRHIDILDDGKLTEPEKEEMVMTMTERRRLSKSNSKWSKPRMLWWNDWLN